MKNARQTAILSIIEQNDMVAVPANGACHMERYFGEESEEGRDLIGNDFCRMIMTVVH